MKSKLITEAVRSQLISMLENLTPKQFEAEFEEIFMDAWDDGPSALKRVEEIVYKALGIRVDIKKDIEAAAKEMVASGDQRKLAQTLFDLKHAIGY
jgi:hypothetical protein